MELAAELEGGLKIGLNDRLTIELEADDDDSSPLIVVYSKTYLLLFEFLIFTSSFITLPL
jgi:hypothetical protein